MTSPCCPLGPKRPPEGEEPISKNQEPKDVFLNWFLEFGSWFFLVEVAAEQFSKDFA
jgi:hypothetical protein